MAVLLDFLPTQRVFSWLGYTSELIMKLFTFQAALLGLSATSSAAVADPITIPASTFTPSTNGTYALTTLTAIIIDTAYADAVDATLDTLIPPTLYEFATTFAADLSDISGVALPVLNSTAADANAIFLTLSTVPTAYLNASGSPSSEGYTLTTHPTGVTITGASPLGAWWASRILLQQAALSSLSSPTPSSPLPLSLPLGTTTSTPGWRTRGMMLDAARHFYPPAFLTSLCAYMSFFGQNTLHLHLSDNLYNNADIYTAERSLELYARFRLWSDAGSVAGLNRFRNESYSREEFDAVQQGCASRGVTVVPEIEAPGHALVVVQWKPELGYEGDLSLLNISHPETIPTMQAVWGEFLPWFASRVVSIGADEYTGPAADYNAFVNAMAGFIGAESGKEVRIWGTFPPVFDGSEGEVVFGNVSVQHWEYFEDDPYYDYILNGYSVVNSNDDFYIVNKWAPPGGYLNYINLTKTFAGAPGGGYWRPNVFSQTNATENPPATEALVLGSVVPLWNDYGANASVYSEAYWAWREGIPALADKQWGGNLSEEAFGEVFERLRAVVPGQNLERVIKSVDGETIFNYTFAADGTLGDTSPNAFAVETDCETTSDGGFVEFVEGCAVTTPHGSKGRNYTLTLASLNVSSLSAPTNATLITGEDSSLMLTPNITFFAGGNYFRLNSTVPLNETVDLSIIGRGNRTFASVKSVARGTVLVDEEEFLAIMGINGLYHHWAEIAIEAPVKTVGGEGSGWSGRLGGFSLTSVA